MSSLAESRWRVHRIGRAATLARAARGALLFGLIGLLTVFAVAVVAGVVTEEVFPDTDVGITLDLILRASLVGVLGLGLCGLILRVLLAALEDSLIVRALVAAKRRGAPATAVPIPLQWKACGKNSPHHEELAQHWTEPHRIVAASKELFEGDVLGERMRAGLDQAPPGAGLHRAVGVLTAVFTVCALAGMTAFQLLVAVAYPDATHTASRQLGERAELSAESEQLVDLLALGMGIAAAIAVLALVGVVLCTIVLRRLEHRELRRALEDPAAVAPPLGLLRRAMAPTSLTVLQVLFGIAGAIGVLGIALWFIGVVADLPDWDHYASAGPELRAATPYGPWILLGGLALMALGILVSAVLDARDQGLRDELVQRWPVRPPATKDENSKESTD